LGTRGLSGTQQVQGISPLTLCGIALAGANLPPNDRGLVEGLLGGEEVASLDLRGCDLVVLSACDTAKGHHARLGPAIASLQTALHAAGARSAITTLWKVDDAVTQKIMTRFYDNLWKKKLSKHEALWQAQQTLRAEKKEDGTPRYGVGDFGAWVLTGDPR
jgi:CHAT domain-containing protein